MHVPVPTNIQQLLTAIEEEWDNIPQVTIHSLINSIRRRCRKDTKEAFLLTLKNTKRKMPRVPAHLSERALGMLQGGQGNTVAYGHKPTVAGTDRTGKKCSSLTSRAFVSPGVMVGFAFIVKGMSVTPLPVLWSGIDLEVEGLFAGNLNTVRYWEDILLPDVVSFLQAPPDMTLQHDNATSQTA